MSHYFFFNRNVPVVQWLKMIDTTFNNIHNGLCQFRHSLAAPCPAITDERLHAMLCTFAHYKFNFFFGICFKMIDGNHRG